MTRNSYFFSFFVFLPAARILKIFSESSWGLILGVTSVPPLSVHSIWENLPITSWDSAIRTDVPESGPCQFFSQPNPPPDTKITFFLSIFLPTLHQTQKFFLLTAAFDILSFGAVIRFNCSHSVDMKWRKEGTKICHANRSKWGMIPTQQKQYEI